MEFVEKVPKTALDVFRMLPEGTLCEVISNTLYMSPTPLTFHQELVSLIGRRIGNHVELHNLGKTYVAPVDVYFENLVSAVQPDILFISTDRLSVVHEKGIYGAPDLIVEVLSEDRKRDTVLKKQLYEQASVKEYFIVDPADKKLVRYDLDNGSFITGFESTGLFTSALLQLEFTF
ncbi:Uma2 family endonuclease [Aridibaculum aurantiacum]|uniref:Uma2 family endonuclease n=1 Tax=Aridibaculum aurantiacum TaxID=2810307 RepID=UPI001A968D17|nr:Uma2 family endonuclease [Aridibaculum aurantiacum]